GEDAGDGGLPGEGVARLGGAARGGGGDEDVHGGEACDLVGGGAGERGGHVGGEGRHGEPQAWGQPGTVEGAEAFEDGGVDGAHEQGEADHRGDDDEEGAAAGAGGVGELVEDGDAGVAGLGPGVPRAPAGAGGGVGEAQALREGVGDGVPPDAAGGGVAGGRADAAGVD